MADFFLILFKFVELSTVPLLDVSYVEANSLKVFELEICSVGLMWSRYLAKDELKYHRHHLYLILL